MNNEKYSKSILVTGGAGHIGSELIKQLVDLGYTYIYSLDNYWNGSQKNHISGCTYFEGDTADISNILLNKKIDVIFHFGEYSRVEQSFLQLDKVFESNYIGTRAVLNFAIKHCCHLIYSCSSAINSVNDERVVNSPYVISKLNNKLLIDSLMKQNILKGNIVYFSNVYAGNEKGSGENATVVAKFLKAAKENKTVRINSPGTQSRQFTHITDVVTALKTIFETSAAGEFWIAADKKHSILELAGLIGVKYVIGDPALGNRMESDIDTAALKALGWEACNSLEDYIASEIREGDRLKHV